MTSDPQRVELWRRCDPSPPAHEALAALTGRAERAATAAGVDLIRREWPTKLDATEHDPGEAARAYARFREWAAAAGVSLAPAFERTTWRDEFTGESGQHVRLPVACLAWYDASDEPTAVYPHGDGEVRTVPDGIARLEQVSGGAAAVSDSGAARRRAP